MRVVILQPSYIPWRGYFHQIQKSDVFVFYDCVQYDDRGWRNRNLVKTQQGASWLTVPVKSKGCQLERTPIRDVEILWESSWSKKHLRTLQLSYSRAAHFREYSDLVQQIFDRRDALLADFTCATTIAIARRLGISDTQFVRSSALPGTGAGTDRLLSLLGFLGATHYITGPAAKAYLEEEKFRAAGISLEYMTYGYPDYPQLYGEFNGGVSILDLLFNCGPSAAKYIFET